MASDCLVNGLVWFRSLEMQICWFIILWDVPINLSFGLMSDGTWLLTFLGFEEKNSVQDSGENCSYTNSIE